MLRFGGVLPGGVFFTVFGSTLAGAWRLPPAGRIRSAAIGLFYALGTVAVAFLPCDLGCDPAQVDPSPSHVLHFAAGTLTYLLTPLALLRRLSKKDLLQLRKKASGSYFSDREHKYGADDLKNPW